MADEIINTNIGWAAVILFGLIIPLLLGSRAIFRFMRGRRALQAAANGSGNRVKEAMSNIPTTKKLMIFAGIATFIVIIVIAAESIVIVQPGHRGVVLYLGKVEGCDQAGNCDPGRIFPEGMHTIQPFVETVIQPEVRVLKFESNATAASKDLQLVSTTIALNYHLDPSAVNKVYQRLGESYADKVISPAIQEGVKASTAKFDAEELITQRDRAKATIEDHISKTLASNDIIADQIYITDFKFSAAFEGQIEAKVVAYQSYLTENNKLLSMNVQALQNVVLANGLANATIAKARGDAMANVERAKGEAEAIKIINEELQRNPQYLQWQMIKQWNGQLPYVMSSSNQGFFPFIDITKLKGANNTGQ